MDAVWTRIDEELSRRHSTWAWLARELGATDQVVNNWRRRGVPSSRYADVAHAFGWAIETLLSQGRIADTEPSRAMRPDVPLISWVIAGGWCESQDPHSPGEAEKWLACNTPHSKGTYALRVRGTSMMAPYGGKAYPPGSIIFVDPAKRSPSNGERIVAKLKGSDEVTFKVFKHEDGRTWLEALNPTHEPIRGDFEVLGTVIGKWEEE